MRAARAMRYQVAKGRSYRGKVLSLDVDLVVHAQDVKNQCTG